MLSGHVSCQWFLLPDHGSGWTWMRFKQSVEMTDNYHHYSQIRLMNETEETHRFVPEDQSIIGEHGLLLPHQAMEQVSHGQRSVTSTGY